MLYLMAKSKLTNKWLYTNEPVTNINVSERCIDCKTLSGKWEIFNNLYYYVMITNSPIKGVDDK